VRNSLVDIDALHNLLIDLFNPLVEASDMILQFLLVVLSGFSVEESIQLEIAVIVAQCIHFNVLKELGGKFVLSAHFEEMLNAI
jgi:ABC-type transport system involved in cytochrome bd biosynthesis fused ATPase/permease subunit